jgi:L-amino acid N-acyltransferase YncA
MIRKAAQKDLAGIMNILQKLGKAEKDPVQGFLMHDYTRNYEDYRDKYARRLAELKYFFVAEQVEEINGFLQAFSKEEWLREEPAWQEDTIWSPHFSRNLLENFVMINQTAILPGLTGKGLGSLLYEALFKELHEDGYTHVFAETIIAPQPNLASLNFRIKHNYQLAGVRYEKMQGTNFTTLVYYKLI